ncbi:hypothetical protein [Soonwooa sp.]|uniref:hypothetical protein n=1 Tax=Soonwooa sp. TaxID=1938592 RepID=UPI0028AC48BD|nr:hypothetical protein [Soonwooa sp.]
MQSNDLNRLIGNYEDYDLNTLKASFFDTTSKPTDEELRKTAKAINPELLKTIRIDVERFQQLGKPRRWIKRWVKRKYNITEY